jgi:nucleoid-associated protein YgaU
MGASKGSPATQVLEWAVGKLDEASKTDWVDKLSSMASSRPAYLRSGVTAPSSSAPAPAAGAGPAELEDALAQAARAEARADSLAQRVAKLEAQLAATNSRPKEVLLPSEEGVPAVGGEGAAEGDDDDHKHWWSRKH